MPASVVITIDSRPQDLFSLLAIYGSYRCSRFRNKTLDYGLVDKTLYRSPRLQPHHALSLCLQKELTARLYPAWFEA